MGKIEYAILVVNQFLSYTVKLCLTADDWQSLCFLLKKCGNLEKDWNPASIKSVVNFSSRPDRVVELIQLIANDEKAWDMMKTIYFQDIILFTYDVRGLMDVNSDYFDPGHDVDNFKSGATLDVEFQILLQNF